MCHDEKMGRFQFVDRRELGVRKQPVEWVSFENQLFTCTRLFSIQVKPCRRSVSNCLFACTSIIRLFIYQHACYRTHTPVYSDQVGIANESGVGQVHVGVSLKQKPLRPSQMITSSKALVLGLKRGTPKALDAAPHRKGLSKDTPIRDGFSLPQRTIVRGIVFYLYNNPQPFLSQHDGQRRLIYRKVYSSA